MKKTIFATCLVSSMIGLTSCETYDDLFPEYCHKALNIKDGGERDITLYTTGEDTEYSFSVMKTGSEENASVTASVVSMTEEDYNAYAEKYNLLQSFLPAEYYTLADNEMSFAGSEGYKFVKIIFKTDQISALVKQTNKDYALPLKLTSSDATVNDSLLILKPSIVVPAISFQNPNYQQLFQFESSSAAEGSFDVPLTMPIENLWDFDCTVKVTDEAKSKFNQLNASNDNKYTLMSDDKYSFEEKVAFTKGNSTASLKVNVNKTDLDRGFYVIPVEITECSKPGFEVSSNSKFVLAGVNFLPDKINLTVDQFSSNAVLNSDGTGHNGLIDGIGDGKHYHTIYPGHQTETPVVDATYGNYFDIHLKSPIQTVMFEYWTRFQNGAGAPKNFKIFVSNDGSSWTELVQIQQGLPNGGNQKYTSKIYKAASTFTYFRFACLESMAGSMTTGGGSYFNLGEFALYGN